MLKKGGIETILLIVIMVAIVMGLLVTAVIPMTDEVQETAGTGIEKLDGLWGNQ